MSSCGSKVSSINGPVSLHVLDWDGRIIYIFGDVHHSKANGCGACCMDIDEALNIWLKYNNSKKIRTDCFVEATPSPRLPSTTNNNWLIDTGALVTPCMIGNRNCAYPNIRMVAFDYRIPVEAGFDADVFFYLSINKHSLQTYRAILDRAMEIALAYVLPGSLSKLAMIADEVDDPIVAKVLHRCAERGVTGEYVGVTGVRHTDVKMHLVAAKLYKLYQQDQELAKMLYNWYLDQMERLVDIAMNDESINSYAVMTNLSSVVTDVCLLSELLCSTSEVSIIHAGLAHTSNCVSFLAGVLGAEVVYEIDNTTSMISHNKNSLDGFDTEDSESIHGLRCISDDNLSEVIDLGGMRSYLAR